MGICWVWLLPPNLNPKIRLCRFCSWQIHIAASRPQTVSGLVTLALPSRKEVCWVRWVGWGELGKIRCHNMVYICIRTMQRVGWSYKRCSCPKVHVPSSPSSESSSVEAYAPGTSRPFHGSLNVPIEHHPTIRYMVYNGYYKVMSNIPKMGQLPTPDDFEAECWRDEHLHTHAYTQID